VVIQLCYPVVRKSPAGSGKNVDSSQDGADEGGVLWRQWQKPSAWRANSFVQPVAWAMMCVTGCQEGSLGISGTSGTWGLPQMSKSSQWCQWIVRDYSFATVNTTVTTPFRSGWGGRTRGFRIRVRWQEVEVQLSNANSRGPNGDNSSYCRC